MAIQVTLKNYGPSCEKLVWERKVLIPVPHGMITPNALASAIGLVANKYDIVGTLITNVRFVNVEVLEGVN